MRKIFLLILLTVSQYSLAQKTSEVPLNEIISVINHSISEAAKTTGDLKIKAATIDLSTAYSSKKGGGFSLILSGSKNWTKELATKVSFNYVEEKDLNTKEVGGPDAMQKNLAENLTMAIIASAEQWSKVNEYIPGLKKEDYSVTISFTIKKNKSGGLSYTIFDIGLDATVDYTNVITHSITVKFE